MHSNHRNENRGGNSGPDARENRDREIRRDSRDRERDRGRRDSRDRQVPDRFRDNEGYNQSGGAGRGFDRGHPAPADNSRYHDRGGWDNRDLGNDHHSGGSQRHRSRSRDRDYSRDNYRRQ
jgi:hypothetical protein